MQSVAYLSALMAPTDVQVIHVMGTNTAFPIAGGHNLHNFIFHIFRKNKTRGLFKPVCVCPSQLSSGPDNLAAFLDVAIFALHVRVFICICRCNDELCLPTMGFQSVLEPIQ